MIYVVDVVVDVDVVVVAAVFVVVVVIVVVLLGWVELWLSWGCDNILEWLEIYASTQTHTKIKLWKTK